MFGQNWARFGENQFNHARGCALWVLSIQIRTAHALYCRFSETKITSSECGLVLLASLCTFYLKHWFSLNLPRFSTMVPSTVAWANARVPTPLYGSMGISMIGNSYQCAACCVQRSWLNVVSDRSRALRSNFTRACYGASCRVTVGSPLGSSTVHACGLPAHWVSSALLRSRTGPWRSEPSGPVRRIEERFHQIGSLHALTC